MYNHGDKKSQHLLSIEASAVTPRTPEIIADLATIAWFPINCGTLSAHNAANAAHQHKLNQCDSHSSCSGSPLDSPTGSNAPPSVEQTRSNLVKATLKRQLEKKRKSSCGDSSENDTMKMAKMEYQDSGDDDDDDDDTDSRSMRCDLTPEDEDRRRRRRERNKIAATKCRKKKRERTDNLNTESEVLEAQHVDLKTQVRELELERQKLTMALQLHTCGLPGGVQLPPPPTISVARFFDDLGNGSNGGTSSSSSSCSSGGESTQPARARNSQPIPSVTTIGKFGHAKSAKGRSRAAQQQQQRHQQQQLQQQQSQPLLPLQAMSPHPNQQLLPTVNSISSSSSSNTPTNNNTALSVTASLEAALTQQQLQQQTAPMIDIDSYLSDAVVSSAAVDLLLPSTYCKPSPNDYAQSPDSGFIAESVDTSYSTGTAGTPSMPTSFMHQIQHINNNNNNNNSNNINNNNMMQQQQHLKNDYIPSPTSHHSLLDALQHEQFGQSPLHQHQHQQQQQQQQQSQTHAHQQQQHQHQHHQQHQQQHQQHSQLLNGHHSHLIGPGDGSEFALKCELVDSVGHSPYTTEQSADRFLYEVGIDGGDSSQMFADTADLCGAAAAVVALDHTDLKMLVANSNSGGSGGHNALHQQQHQQHQLNNNNSSNNMNTLQHQPQQQMSNNQLQQQQQQPAQIHQQQQQQMNQQQQQQQQHHQQQQHQQQQLLEFSHCHGTGFDGLKSDYQQNADFLSLADASAVIGNDAHFTDMDSGMATYTNFLTNTGGTGGNNGCLA